MNHSQQNFPDEEIQQIVKEQKDDIGLVEAELLQPDHQIDNAPIGVSAALSANQSTIVVNWNASNGSISLAQSDITTGVGTTTTLLDRGSPHYPPYNDTKIQRGHTYQYILTTLNNDVQYYSKKVTVPSVPHPIGGKL